LLLTKIFKFNLIKAIEHCHQLQQLFCCKTVCLVDELITRESIGRQKFCQEIKEENRVKYFQLNFS